MKCIHTTKAIDGLDYNRETADRCPTTRTVHVPGLNGWQFELEVTLPAYIMAALASHDWDRVQARLALFVAEKQPTAQLLGVPRERFELLVGIAARKALYDCFVTRQERAGNDAWATPMLVFGDQYPGVANA